MKSNLADENFPEQVENYTGNPLNRKEDIRRIIEIVIENNKEEEFESLVFTAKYVCGMLRIVNNSNPVPEVQNVDNIKVELNENIMKGVVQLRDIISGSDISKKDYFENTYLSLTAHSFNNLVQLFSDLEAVKKYLNYKKRLT